MRAESKQHAAALVESQSEAAALRREVARLELELRVASQAQIRRLVYAVLLTAVLLTVYPCFTECSISGIAWEVRPKGRVGSGEGRRELAEVDGCRCWGR